MRLILQRSLAVIAATLILAGSSAYAALPPQHQRMAELQAVINAAAAGGVPDAVGEIISIAYIGSDLYEIAGITCSVLARIVTTPQKGPPLVGPRQFEVRLEPPICR
ncbi:MAG: hypothetical protein KIT43_12100 [Bauldia sp.]|nr:hypothetical protein [Bauldia sp.]MCW5719312.1 hypothetical protein [Bauldia sp.]